MNGNAEFSETDPSNVPFAQRLEQYMRMQQNPYPRHFAFVAQNAGGTRKSVELPKEIPPDGGMLQATVDGDPYNTIAVFSVGKTSDSEVPFSAAGYQQGSAARNVEKAAAHFVVLDRPYSGERFVLRVTTSELQEGGAGLNVDLTTQQDQRDPMGLRRLEPFTGGRFDSKVILDDQWTATDFSLKLDPRAPDQLDVGVVGNWAYAQAVTNVPNPSMPNS